MLGRLLLNSVRRCCDPDQIWAKIQSGGAFDSGSKIDIAIGSGGG